MIELYQFEGCPYCAKVREALSRLEVDYITRTVPRGSSKRQFLMQIGGKQQVPFLVDQDNGIEMYESDYIIAYLEQQYGTP